MMSKLTQLTKPLYYTSVATNGHLTLGGAEMASKIRVALTWLLLTAVFTAATCFLPCQLPLAFDWLHFFENAHNIPAYYPPWTGLVLRWLPWPLLIGLTLSTYTIAVVRRARSGASAVSAFITFPLWWCLFLGQIDGLVLLGVMGLPWLTPLALMKPQVACFAILAKRKYLIVAVCFVLLSCLIWGLWPLDMMGYHTGRTGGLGHASYIGLGLRGIPLAILALCLIPGWTKDKLMVAGTFVTPALIPYQLLLLMPMIASMPWYLAIITAVATWFPMILAGDMYSASNRDWLSMWFSVVLIGAGLARRNE